jgi:ABC-2 type transport system ATP-binding protein
MPGRGPSATASSDIAVDLTHVTKAYRQRHRVDGFAGTFRGLFRPNFHEVTALNDIDVRIQRGETVAYAGPNGAGKSTTIKLLAGILAPDAGTVRVFGTDPVANRKRHVARIGVVFGHRTELWNDHPVITSFEWKRAVWRIPDERYQRMLGVVTELLDLSMILPALARELSLGQRMRAELGLVLLHEPELLLLDEPTIGLDVLGKRRILDFIKELHQTRAVTIVVTSHDMSDLEQLAERIVMVKRGTVAFDGDFRRLRRHAVARRILIIETAQAVAPDIDGAELVTSEENRHRYLYDPENVRLADLLAQAERGAEVLDVETHRANIDDVVADLYQEWLDQQAADAVDPAR